MMIKILLICSLLFVINLFIKKKKYLKSSTGSFHQTFVNSSIPLTGGIFISIPIIYFFYPNYFEFTVIFISLFLLGLSSDLNIIESPKKRFLYQFLVLLCFSLYTQLEVLPSRIDFLDDLLIGTFLSFVFTSFCLMVLINGSNFIDGLNGLFLGYFLIVLLILQKLNFFPQFFFDKNNASLLIFIIFFVLVLNFFNQLFAGDSGSYSLSFLLGFALIKIYNLNAYISPYFIILLLWYPCFENLFSIIRKTLNNKNPLLPDNEHLHHFLFIILKNKFNINQLLANNLSSILINLFNFLILYIGSMKISYTIFQLQMIAVSVFSYVFFYFMFKKLALKKKFKHTNQN
tara:strand:- start:6117 stop:7151 length:1035 start_codon:yes stop_codon:yes gene_type:complete